MDLRAPDVVCGLEQLPVGAVTLAFQVNEQDEAEGGGVDAIRKPPT
jgi:hypothetical protein